MLCIMSRLCGMLLLLSATTSLLTNGQDSGYIDCHCGTLNVILSAPHGGCKQPSDIADRDAGCFINADCVWSHSCGTKNTTRCAALTSKDSGTLELTTAVRNKLHTLTGKYPHVVINKLHRKKLDANRDIEEGAFNVSQAKTAWEEYHTCITNAKSAINGPGLLLDFHGYSYDGSTPWAILGYRIKKTRLENDNIIAEYTSIKALQERHPNKTINEIVKGAESFGAYLESYGYLAMPSQSNTAPNTINPKYFSGGYTIKTHGSKSSGYIDAIQIESPPSFRETPLDGYAQAIAKAISDFVDMYY